MAHKSQPSGKKSSKGGEKRQAVAAPRSSMEIDKITKAFADLGPTINKACTCSEKPTGEEMFHISAHDEGCAAKEAMQDGIQRQMGNTL